MNRYMLIEFNDYVYFTNVKCGLVIWAHRFYMFYLLRHDYLYLMMKWFSEMGFFPFWKSWRTNEFEFWKETRSTTNGEYCLWISCDLDFFLFLPLSSIAFCYDYFFRGFLGEKSILKFLEANRAVFTISSVWGKRIFQFCVSYFLYMKLASHYLFFYFYFCEGISLEFLLKG